MYREITKELIKWKDNSRRKPLILTGVRQCEKTYIIDDTAVSLFFFRCHRFQAMPYFLYNSLRSSGEAFSAL